ncbi:MAG TPA: CHASE domain-containing protein [Patescibacteria group bacterium]|nr:CHASE domain-containing protein [Patescibacteria group bacterium]
MSQATTSNTLRVRRLWGVLRRVLGAIGRAYHSLYFPPAVICVVILLITMVGWVATRHSREHDLLASENSKIANIQHFAQSQLNAYEEILIGGVGLLHSTGSITQTTWAQYLSAFDLAQNYPSALGVGYGQVVSSDELPDIEAMMTAQGVDNFTLQPATPPRDVYALTLYSSSDNRMPGFDLYADGPRGQAAKAARDTGSPTISEPLTLKSTTLSSNDRGGFLLFVPYYAPDQGLTTIADRQATIRGYVYVGFHTSAFFKGIIADSDAQKQAVSISDGSALLYKTPAFDSIGTHHGIIRVTQPVTIYGRTWTFTYEFARTALLSQVQLNRPTSVLVFGAFMSVVVPLIILLLLRARAGELQIQKEHDLELAKDELLSLASHQLRTPATGVKQYLGMVLQGFVGKIPINQREILEKAYASNDRQLQVINEILHLAKIDAGRIVLARRKTNIVELVSDVVQEQRPDIVQAKHTLIKKMPKQAINLAIDAHMVRMAIENLLSNAIKYTPRNGTIAVTIRQTRHAVTISIDDNGVGIAEEDFNKLFKQFSRLPNEMSQQVGGTGVGLYLAKHLIELHGGTVKVTSRLHEGAIFTVTLPKKQGDY